MKIVLVHYEESVATLKMPVRPLAGEVIQVCDHCMAEPPERWRVKDPVQGVWHGSLRYFSNGKEKQSEAWFAVEVEPA